MPADPVAAPRRLLLLRHAKAVPHEHDDTDHARPLASPRADAQLAATGAALLAHPTLPDLVLCSDALRTRQTWEKLPRFPSGPPELRLMPSLYLAEACDLLAELRRVSDTHRTVLLIGHNPGLHALAFALAGRARAERVHLAAGFPTAALASFDLADAPWSRLGPDDVTGLAVHRS